MVKPTVLIIYPPVYDFALYDLYFKPMAIYNLKQLLVKNGWNVITYNYLEYQDEKSKEILGSPLRKQNGQGKFFKQQNKKYFSDNISFAANRLNRGFFRYGVIEESAEEFFSSIKPDVVLISSGMTYWYYGLLEAFTTVKKIFKSIPVGVGGIYATLMPEHCKKIMAPDAIFVGDELLPLLNFCKLAAEKNGKTLNKTELIKVEDLDPNPEDCCGESAVIRLNYGCPYHCEYCASNLLCNKFVSGVADKKFSYFYSLYQKGIRNFAFYDDALLIDSEKVFIPFIKKVVDNCPGASFWTPNAVHIHSINEEIATLMFKAGFKELRLGFESSDENFHDKYDKKYKVDEFEKAVTILKNCGFSKEQIKVYILAGLPMQKAEQAFRSLEYAKKFQVSASIAEFSPVPKTKIWQKSVELSKFDITNEPIFQNNTFFAMEWEGFTIEELISLKKLSHQ